VRLFELRHFSAHYNGREVLSNVSLNIDAGERVALIGKSGAGKSTLLALFYEQQRANASLVPQELGLVKSLSVFHTVYRGRLHRHGTCYNLINLVRPLRREVDAVRKTMAELELEEKLFAAVGELSGGQQQRTAVGRAVHQGSPILLADEPVSSVDEHQSRVVLETINARHDTVILAMHDINLALANTDRVIGLQSGRVVIDEVTAGLTSGDLDTLYTS
jgi:phosphonate transport system ATP-binding protein